MQRKAIHSFTRMTQEERRACVFAELLTALSVIGIAVLTAWALT